MSRTRVLVVALALPLLAALLPNAAVATAPAGTAVRSAAVHVGTLDLTPCDVVDGALCGTFARPWDPTGLVPGAVDVGFAFVPATDTSRPAVGTVVPHEGGPGYATTSSGWGYVGMYGSLLERRNLLLVDQRGTGRSAAIDCPELQDLRTSYPRAAAACARRLGDHAHLYGSALSADDLSAVVTALGLDKVDVYGDSYGTFFTQVFASRHPDQVRSLVLDSAYPTFGESAWYPTQTPAMRSSFDKVCARTPSCARFGVRTTSRIAALVKQLRVTPIVGRVFGGDGARHRIVLDAQALVLLVFNATYGPVTYRETDAAIRAWSARHDAAPLLRLVAEAQFPGGGASAPTDYSEGLDAAVSCQDYPQLYDMRATPSARLAQYRSAVRARTASAPRTYGPFTVSEYVSSDWAQQDWCRTWPTAPTAYRQGPIRPPGGHYPASVPVLVMSGELDSITTPAEGAMVARQWPTSRQVHVANSFHVTAVGDTDTCAVRIVQAFVRTASLAIPPSTLACASRVPPGRATPAFRTRSAQAPAATPLAGSTTSRIRLSAARTAAETVADVLDRWYQTLEVGGVGLRGGTWTGDGDDDLTITLDRYRLVSDLAVSGTVTWGRYTHKVTVRLVVDGTTASGRTVRDSSVSGVLRGAWDSRARGAQAVLTGRLGGRPVRASLPAP